MRHYLSAVLIASSLVAGAALAQNFTGPYGEPGYARRDHAIFDRARMDLDRAANYPYSSRADRRRFDDARRDLFDFESRFDQGRYDKHELNKAIDRMQSVVSHNSLDPRDRGALEEDLRRMRDYRAFRDHHGYRDFDYGYRP
jgi:hypothetical protein